MDRWKYIYMYICISILLMLSIYGLWNVLSGNSKLTTNHKLKQSALGFCNVRVQSNIKIYCLKAIFSRQLSKHTLNPHTRNKMPHNYETIFFPVTILILGEKKKEKNQQKKHSKNLFKNPQILPFPQLSSAIFLLKLNFLTICESVTNTFLKLQHANRILACI